MELVDELSDLLQVHANRDKVVCLTSYVLKLWGSTSKSQPLLTASAKLAGARACLRLFDDAAVLKNTINYGFGKQEGPVWGTLGMASGVFTLVYLQAEKLSWLIDAGLLKVDSEVEFKVKTAHKLFWSLMSFVGLVRTIRALHICAKELNSPEPRKCSKYRFNQACLMSSKAILDVVHSVSWLPPGWMWGSKLSVQQASSVATLGAVIGLLAHYRAKKLAGAR